MKIKYENNYKLSICSICNYKHIERYSYKEPIEIDLNDLENLGKEPFLENINPFIYEEMIDYAPSRTKKHTIYACPQCGVLQICPD